MKYELRIMVFLLAALSMILASLFITQPVHAQTTAASPLQPTTYNLPTTVSPTSPLYTDLLLHNMFHSFSCIMVGSSFIGQPCLTYQGGIPVLSQANLSGGLLGTTGNLIGMLYTNPPVRSVDYLASVGEGLGIVKEAHAQVVGSGANVLSPILTLWKVSRNISYLIMVLIFVIIGLMVMFRNRINPQTVITAQAALPGLIIGLILITFSYFMSALISDTAFVGTNIVGYYFSIAQRPGDTPQNLVADISSKNILNIFTPFTKALSQSSVAGALDSIWDDLADPNTCRHCPTDLDPQKVLTILTGFIISQVLSPFGSLGGGIGQVIAGLTSFVGAAAGAKEIASFALAFIAMAILIYAMFRLLLRLINNYITIIFLTITAPFQFLAAALPGRQGIATDWILNMLANILAFPAVLAVFYFVAFILGSVHPINDGCNTFPTAKPNCAFIISQLNQTEQNNFVPVAHAAGGVVGDSAFPLFGGFDLGFINLLLAFGALVALPAIPDIIARTIGKVSQAGQLIGQELSGSTREGRGYAGQVSQGTSGMAGQVGRLQGERGLILASDPNNPDKLIWRRPSAGNVAEMLAGGTRAGQATRFKEGVGDFFGGIRKTFKR